MSLKHAILAVLSHAERTGYELTKKMDGSVKNFWPASHQQIYLELGKLDELGLVRFKEEEQKGKPNKKVYSITRSGLKELKHWISKPSKAGTFKDPLLLKLFASHLMEREALALELKCVRKEHHAKLTEYLALEQAYFVGKNLSAKLEAQYLTLRRGIIFEQSWLKWCDESLARVEKR